jgi:hypothetical protein
MLTKINILVILSVFLLAVHTETFRLLQNNGTFCLRWSADGSACLQCTFRSFFDINSGQCQKVGETCETWNLANGDCLTCLDGYGSSPTNGSAVNGQCPPYSANNVMMDPNCQIYDQNRTCTTCFPGYYLDTSMSCLALPAGCAVV